MQHGTFIWADLSTFRIDVTKSFYRSVLGWTFQDDLALVGQSPTAALFVMPEKFQKIGMPSFWMSYIAVDDVHAAIATAETLGGKVELGPEPFEDGQIALIRDPLGAGFTVYAVPELGTSTLGPGARVGHGLFVSDSSKIIAFYEGLFGWRFQAMQKDVQAVTKDGEHLFHCHTIPDPAVRGKEEYWGVFFAANDIQAARSAVTQAGGEVLTDIQLPEGPALLARDPDGGAFFLLSTGQTPLASPPTPWLSWVGIALVLVSSFSAQLWPWAIFLTVWIWVGLKDEETYLLQRLSRFAQPITYWTVMGVYAALLLLVILAVAGRI